MRTTATEQAGARGARGKDAPVDVRIVLSALWVAMLLVFAYVDVFAFYRADVVEAALEGQVGATGLAVNQVFLAGALVYVLVPISMVVLSLVLQARVNRVANLVASLLYAVTVAISCIGEGWAYYLVGSAAEVVLLLTIARTAWTWRASQCDVPAERDGRMLVS